MKGIVFSYVVATLVVSTLGQMGFKDMVNKAKSSFPMPGGASNPVPMPGGVSNPIPIPGGASNPFTSFFDPANWQDKMQELMTQFQDKMQDGAQGAQMAEGAKEKFEEYQQQFQELMESGAEKAQFMELAQKMQEMIPQ